MTMPLMRIPYTDPLPLGKILPAGANTTAGAVAALSAFLSAGASGDARSSTVLLTGAGISVASGLADYRGTKGTYTLNKTYRPIYYNEFISNHEARKRYWARSFIGWTTLNKARPNRAHYAVRELWNMRKVSGVITQNVDSFHLEAHPLLPTVELHGYLRTLVCVDCQHEVLRMDFQKRLSTLNPAWAVYLAEILATGALDTEHPEERRRKGLRTNPDGDVDIPDAPYTTFRYPACPRCLRRPPMLADGTRGKVETDADGAWLPSSTSGVLKPAVVMFGETISEAARVGAENAIDRASRLLIIGSSLATYSAWRLAKRANENGKPIGILNLGGVRGESQFFDGIADDGKGREAVRVAASAEQILPMVVDKLKT